MSPHFSQSDFRAIYIILSFTKHGKCKGERGEADRGTRNSFLIPDERASADYAKPCDFDLRRLPNGF